MASAAGITRALAFIQVIFPNFVIQPGTVEAWEELFAAWTDRELAEATKLAAMEPGREFAPTPGAIVAARGESYHVDPGKLLRTIEKLSLYSPNIGMIPPSVHLVGEQLGAAAAAAYANAGEEQLFSDNDITRDRARRLFAEQLPRVVATYGPPKDATALLNTATPRMLGGARSEAPEQRRLSSGDYYEPAPTPASSKRIPDPEYHPYPPDDPNHPLGRPFRAGGYRPPKREEPPKKPGNLDDMVSLWMSRSGKQPEPV